MVYVATYLKGLTEKSFPGVSHLLPVLRNSVYRKPKSDGGVGVAIIADVPAIVVAVGGEELGS